MLPLLPLRTGQALSALGLCPACLFCQEHPPPTPAVPSELLHCPQSPIALYPSQRSGELMPQLQGTRSPCHPLCLLPRLGKGLGMLRTGRVKVSPWSCCASPTSPGHPSQGRASRLGGSGLRVGLLLLEFQLHRVLMSPCPCSECPGFGAPLCNIRIMTVPPVDS